MFDKLSAPFAPEQIHWRAQTLTRNKEKALALAYLDARDVMDRLDEAVGPGNWQDSYVETVKGRVVCTISLRVGEEWVSKSDGAGDTAVEGEKGGVSDAFKRAAVKWGIGRYLYRLNDVWAPCELYNDKWTKWKPEAARQFTAALLAAAKGIPSPAPEMPTGPINDKTRDWLAAQVDATGKPVGELCKAFDVTSLKALTYEQMPAVKAWIEERKAA
jgi:hypothetical protein